MVIEIGKFIKWKKCIIWSWISRASWEEWIQSTCWLFLKFSIKTYREMTSSSNKNKKGSEMLVWGVDCKKPNFKLSLAIAEALDPAIAQSQIIPKVLIMHNIHSFYHFSIQELKTLEINKPLKELCVDGALKPKHQHLETKGLTHISHMPRKF